MSSVGTQRAIAILIFLSPWIYIPMPIKELVFIVAGVLLFVSTLDVKRAPKHKEGHASEAHHAGDSSPEAPHHHPSVPSI